MILKNIKSKIRKAILGYDITTYHFAQCAEDAILKAILWKKLKEKEKGFFIDIGAYHPYKASNSYFFYINGWTGINIEARPGSMKLFNKIRPRDINLEIGIGEKEETLTYYFIDENSPVNSFSRQHLEEIGLYREVKKEIPVKVFPLSDILDKYAAQIGQIDFLSIDVEGWDLKVLKSNNWSKYKPLVIVAELDCNNVSDVQQNETAKFLVNLGYRIVAKNVILTNLASVFFVDSNFEY